MMERQADIDKKTFRPRFDEKTRHLSSLHHYNTDLDKKIEKKERKFSNHIYELSIVIRF